MRACVHTRTLRWSRSVRVSLRCIQPPLYLFLLHRSSSLAVSLYAHSPSEKRRTATKPLRDYGGRIYRRCPNSTRYCVTRFRFTLPRGLGSVALSRPPYYAGVLSTDSYAYGHLRAEIAGLSIDTSVALAVSSDIYAFVSSNDCLFVPARHNSSVCARFQSKRHCTLHRRNDFYDALIAVYTLRVKEKI